MSKPVSFRLPPPDLAIFLDKVRASGLSPSDFFRDCVLTNRTQVVSRQAMTRDQRRALFHLSKAGNNINQLARRANADHLAGVLRQDTYESIAHSLEAIEMYLRLVATRAD